VCFLLFICQRTFDKPSGEGGRGHLFEADLFFLSHSSFSKLPGASLETRSPQMSLHCRVMQPRTHTKVCTDCATGDDLIIAARPLFFPAHPPSSRPNFSAAAESNANGSLITFCERRKSLYVHEINVCLCNAIPADLRFFCSARLVK
jgi:hypothetical protein